MRPLKLFDEFLSLGTVVRRSPDIERSKSLVLDAKSRLAFLRQVVEKIGVNDANANYFVEGCYDVLIGLVRANLLIKGFHASGEGAHEAEVSFLRVLGFSEGNVRFMNDLRYFRNGILYYGERYDADYANKVLDFMFKVNVQLLKVVDDHKSS